jgi:hypothetical protein
LEKAFAGARKSCAPAVYTRHMPWHDEKSPQGDELQICVDGFLLYIECGYQHMRRKQASLLTDGITGNIQIAQHQMVFA